jgi:hypothetical protein
LFDSTGNGLISNTICDNGHDIFAATAGNSGDFNTCDTTTDWNDVGTTGCTDACPVHIPGDTDEDGDVDKDDLQVFDTCANGCIIANVNCDEMGVNVIDLQFVKDNVFCTDETHTPCVISDVNRDGDVNVIDLQDAKNSVFCTDGSTPAAPGCEWADFNTDGVVDHNDYATMQECLSGPGIPGDPTCAD